MTYSDIKAECETMQANLECLIPDSINEVIERAKEIAIYKARAGYLLPLAKKMARKRKTSEIGDTITKIAKQNYLSATAQNALVDSIADDEMYLVDWLDRINANCKYQLDLCRSIISKEKTEMQYLNLQT